ncbi:ATP-binding protein [Pseudoroseomonas cervicalis]|uniref:ATP-binding protein n=1 Tax=Teichococcus cervicalis TaxID=204525 RepID=UPI0022F1A189|nr:ATP-binding protein [Pseudoroseomonas cervicalis]WBV44268.1 ATP-binding protein [Pseudoroseomonas cervicalis]
MRDLFQLDLPAQPHAIAVARAAAGSLAEALALPEAKRDRLELAVEEAVANAVHHAYPPGHDGLLRVSATAEAGALVLRVQDWGLPYQPATPEPGEAGEGGGLGLLLAFRMADEASYRALGRDGKRFEFRFRLPAAAPLPPPPELAESAPPRRARGALTMRRFRPEDAPGIARCAWLAYGYTRPDDGLYDVEGLIRRNAAGEMASGVAVAEDGSIVGHISLDFSAGPHVPEATDMVVAPEWRSHPLLLARLLDFGQAETAAMGCRGWLVHAVSAHTVSQRGALRYGAVPVNVHLASVSTDWAIDDSLAGSGARQSEVALYRGFHPGAPRTLHAPPRHRAVLEDIYAALAEPVTFADGAPPASGRTRLHVSQEYALWGHVVLEVEEYGADAVEAVAGFLRGFCLQGAATVLLELPLADPATAALAEGFEALGFSLCGILPHAGEGDADLLLYQYLNNVVPETGSERIATACRPLYDYVLAERRRIDLAVFGAHPEAAPRP